MTGSRPAVDGRWTTRLALARSDLLEFVRDRRALVITLLMPMVMYPLLALSSTLGIRTAISELERQERSDQLTLVLSGPDAEGLAGCLGIVAAREEARPAGWPEPLLIKIAAADEALALLDAAAADAWIDVPVGTLAALAGNGTTTLVPRFSTSRPPDRRVRELVLDAMKGVADEVGRERLRRAGLPTSIVEPLRIEFAGDTPTGQAGEIRGLVPSAVAAVLVLLAVLTATGAFYPAIDALAGEKERGTVETLLMSPCAAFDVVVGKFLAVFVVTLATLLANAVSIVLTATVLLRLLPAGAVAAAPAGAAASCITITVAAYIGLAAVAAALCLAVTAASRSAKEAQNTLTPVVMLIAALAGSALLPNAAISRWVAAVPFAGQVAVARSVLAMFLEQPADGSGDAGGAGAGIVVRLAASLIGSAAAAWILLAVTASLVANEEILFRGPAAASRALARPRPRLRPSIGQAIAAAVMGVAALWYVQGLAPSDFATALMAQQAVAVLLPLLAISWWQRVDAGETFGFRWPAANAAGIPAAVMGAAAVGSGLFVLGAAATLAVRGSVVSAEAAGLARQLVDLILGGPTWAAVSLLSVMPAVCEELLFRGWMLAGLAGRMPTARRAAWAVGGQAAAFAAFHLLPERMPQTFALGVVAGVLTLATRSLLPAIVMHAAHNATPVLLVAAATPEEIDVILHAGRGLPAWIVGGGLGCLVLGGLLVTAACRGRQESEAWKPSVEDDSRTC
ncbi:MAG: CPBP family intramembrane metalloprotease [Planctomycetes bacterium]|nr:CPBP family intramembrane metalloprotease [Planctomycetota bacterium]